MVIITITVRILLQLLLPLTAPMLGMDTVCTTRTLVISELKMTTRDSTAFTSHFMFDFVFLSIRDQTDQRPGGSLALSDILPADSKSYDKNRPPKNSDRNATIVYFHVTVLSIDSIDEESMVSLI